jgi:AhpD family alkylhydroperoxidase
VEPRIDLYAPAHAGALKAMLGLESHVRRSGIEPSLLHLIKTRASQINGCAYCIDMHTKDARAEAETEQRLYALDAWRETPFFSARERAALEWTESLTWFRRHTFPTRRTPACASNSMKRSWPI